MANRFRNSRTPRLSHCLGPRTHWQPDPPSEQEFEIFFSEESEQLKRKNLKILSHGKQPTRIPYSMIRRHPHMHD